MKTINTSIKKLGIFTIGQQNDNEVLDIVFDISEWRGLYPELTSYGIIITSPDNVVYPANTEVIWDELVWHVSGADTAVVGEGEYQIVAVSENGNKKHTTPQKFSIIANMPGIEDAGDAPEHIEPWYEGVVQKASEAQESARKAEEAAQRAENAGVSQEAIGNAVADYLAKNPVYEKDPTVPEWAKAKEKPKYTAEEVGALPKYTPIPDAYTLPVASADTLGGVKINPKHFRMDGDVLGVVPEGEFELIETFEFTEGNMRYVKNVTPDGRDWCFSSVFAEINLNGNAMTENRGFNIWGTPNFGEQIYGYTVASDSGNKKAQAYLYSKNGVWQARCSGMSGNELRPSSLFWNGFADDITTKKLPAIYGISTSNWPVGTTIKIWGVWKDA